jgi:hypothetical protein
MANPIVETEIVGPKKTGWEKTKDIFGGKNASYVPIPTGTPQQTDARRQLLEKVLGPLLAHAGKNPKAGITGKPYQGAIDKILQMMSQPQQQANPTLGVNPQTQQLLGQTLQGSQSPQGYGFQGIEDRARQQFENKTLPTLAQRFTNMSGNSRQGSSDYNGALRQAGVDLESQLGALRSQYGLQERGLLGQEQGQRQSLLGGLLGYGLQGQGQNTRQQLANQNQFSTLAGAQNQQQGIQQNQQSLNQGQQNNQLNYLLALLGQGGQSPFNPIYQPATGGIFGGLANGWGQAQNAVSNQLGKLAVGSI